MQSIRRGTKSRKFAARWIVPIGDGPIDSGWIEVHGARVTQIDQGKPPGDAEDLGDVAILPGLVNAHTHLEFSDCSSPIGEPGIALSDWVIEVIQARINLERDTDAAVTRGWSESLRSGVRLIADIATPPLVYPPMDDGPQDLMECVTFSEVLGLSADRFAERYGAMIQHAEQDTDQNVTAGISPHAPYSITSESMQRCVKWSAANDANFAMHLAESPEERELLVQGTGLLRDRLAAMDLPVDQHFPLGDDPFVTLIQQIADCHRGLIVHGNDLRDHEIDELAKHENLSVVFCPRTHAFFQFHRHPVDKMMRAGIRIALGTDSRASNPDLNLWNEVRYLLNNRQDIEPAKVLEMATANGADALGRSDLGRLKVGTQPGLVAVPTTANSIDDLYRDLAGNACGRLL